MIRFLAQSALTLLANAIGLTAAAILLDGFSINTFSFVVAVVIFTLATIVLGPLILKTARAHAPYLVSGIALVTTLAGLIVTRLFTDGLSIKGLSTWVLATLVVWLFALLANVLLPLALFKEALRKKSK